jgi:mono/diheme cytochrome c family protein
MMKSESVTKSAARFGSVAGSALCILAATGCNLYLGTPEEFIEEEKAECLQQLQENSFNDSFPLNLGPTVKAEDPPPAISGGTMALSPDENTLVASDPDRDQVYIVDLANEVLLHTVPMLPQDEPGRVAIDDSGRAHIALRRGNKVVTINMSDGSVLGRHKACAAPRGIDFDELTGLLYVACHNGKLVGMDPNTGNVISDVRIEPGLRDVVVTTDHIYVSKFRTADLFVLNRNGDLLSTMRPPGLDTIAFDFETGEETNAHFEAAVAWRTIANRNNDGVIMVHQRGLDTSIKPTGGGYGGDFCQGGVLHTVITPMKFGVETPVSAGLPFMVLPVDASLVANGNNAVVVAAGNGADGDIFAPPVMDFPVQSTHQEFDCLFGSEWGPFNAEPTAVVSRTDDLVVVQHRQPAELRIFQPNQQQGGTSISLSNTSRQDTGHTLFHKNTGAGISCASCHPEGADDGRVWQFECIGDRRTQPLHFGVLGTEPFHWDGDMADFSHLMNEVFVGRMSGGQPNGEQIEAMASWLDTVKAPTRAEPEDAVAMERGRALFNDPTVGCAGCHAGSKLLTTGSYDVGTGGTFQVPSLLGIADRTPYLHSGCARTLRERFTNPACGGGDQHGVTSHLSATQLDDLIVYLHTL